jgi:hypothetical protein
LPVAAARPIVLTAAERLRLEKAAWGHKTEHRVRVRAQIVLWAARGRSNARNCEPTTGIAPFMTLVAQVISQESYASAKRVFWIVDNGSSHRGKAAVDRLAAAFRPPCWSTPRCTPPG